MGWDSVRKSRHAKVAKRLLEQNPRATNGGMLQALMEATHSPEELAKFHAELEAEQGVKPLDTSSVRALAASIREQAASIRELAAVLRRPRVRTGTVETPSGPVTMTIRESRDG